MGNITKINKYEHQIEYMISFCLFDTVENQICNKQLFKNIGMLFMIADLCLKNKQSNCVKKKNMVNTNTCILKNSDVNFHSHTIPQQRQTKSYAAKTLRHALILVHYKHKKTTIKTLQYLTQRKTLIY